MFWCVGGYHKSEKDGFSSAAPREGTKEWLKISSQEAEFKAVSLLSILLEKEVSRVWVYVDSQQRQLVH